MRKERKIAALTRVLGDPSVKKGDEHLFFCPWCSHRKPKLCVNVKEDVFHCWVCGKKGKDLSHILKINGETADLKEYVSSRDVGQTEHVEKTYDDVVLPDEFLSLSRTGRSPYYLAAMDYLGRRGLKMGDILRWRLGYCEEGKYKNRVVIPSFDVHGFLNFFTARSIYRGVRSYDHGNFSKDIVWNELLLDWSRPITLVEGPFDAIKVRDNVVALQGSSLRTGSLLFTRLVKNSTDVYISLDSDARERQTDIAKRLIQYGVRCWYVPLMGKKDPGEMSPSEFADAKNNASVPMFTSLDILKERVSR